MYQNVMIDVIPIVHNPKVFNCWIKLLKGLIEKLSFSGFIISGFSLMEKGKTKVEVTDAQPKESLMRMVLNSPSLCNSMIELSSSMNILLRNEVKAPNIVVTFCEIGKSVMIINSHVCQPSHNIDVVFKG